MNILWLLFAFARYSEKSNCRIAHASAGNQSHRSKLRALGKIRIIMSESDYSHQDLTGHDFSNATLEKAIFTGANRRDL